MSAFSEHPQSDDRTAYERITPALSKWVTCVFDKLTLLGLHPKSSEPVEYTVVPSSRLNLSLQTGDSINTTTYRCTNTLRCTTERDAGGGEGSTGGGVRYSTVRYIASRVVLRSKASASIQKKWTGVPIIPHTDFAVFAHVFLDGRLSKPELPTPCLYLPCCEVALPTVLLQPQGLEVKRMQCSQDLRQLIEENKPLFQQGCCK